MSKKFCYLIGYPVEHSVSPAIHNAAYKFLEMNREYALFEVTPEKLKEAVDVLKEPSNVGFNVTIPHKQTIMPYLDMVTELAEKLGSVNTVKIQDGKLIGYNTDAPAFIDSLKEDAGFNPKGKRVLLLGAGGAGRALAAILAESKVKSLFIMEPQSSKLDEVLQFLSKNYPECEIRRVENIQSDLDASDLLVNASPVGMFPKADACPLPETVKFHPKLLVFDLVYNPEKTLLMARAVAAKAKAFSGIGMLVRQGALAFTIINGTPAPFRVMLKAAQAALIKQNEEKNDN